MKHHIRLTVTVAAILGVVTGQPTRAGSVNELRNQDTAFALTTEAFRLVQSSLIVADYYSRLAAAQHQSSRNRQSISTLAEMERQLRERKLATQVEQLQVAYDFSRSGDERRLGVTVPQQPDRQVVNQQLRKTLPAAIMEADTPVFVAADLTGLAALNGWLHPATESPARVKAPDLPASYAALVDILKRADGPTHPLVSAVRETFRRPLRPDADLEPAAQAFALVSYRKSGETIRDVVIQVIYPVDAERPAKVAGRSQAVNPQKAELCDRLDQWSALLTHGTGRWYGDARLVDERRQVFDQALQGDLTFVQKLTAEPLYIVGILPNPHAYLPACLQKRVTGIVARADLAQPDWQVTVQLLTLDSETAEQTAGLLESWRMMVTSLMTSKELKTGTAKPCRRVIDAGTVRVNGSRVLVAGSFPSLMGLHGADRVLQWAIADAR